MLKGFLPFRVGLFLIIQTVGIPQSAYAVTGLQAKLIDNHTKSWLSKALASDLSLTSDDIQKIVEGPAEEMRDYFSKLLENKLELDDLELLKEKLIRYSKKYPHVFSDSKKEEISVLINHLEKKLKEKKVDHVFIIGWLSLEKYFELFPYFQTTHIYLRSSKKEIENYLNNCLIQYNLVFSLINQKKDIYSISLILNDVDKMTQKLQEQFDLFQSQNTYYGLLLLLKSLEKAPQSFDSNSTDKLRDSIVFLESVHNSYTLTQKVNKVLSGYFQGLKFASTLSLNQKFDLIKIKVVCSYVNSFECHQLLNDIYSAHSFEDLKIKIIETMAVLKNEVEQIVQHDPLLVVKMNPYESRALLLQSIILNRFILDQVKEGFIQNLTLSQKTFYWKKDSILNAIQSVDDSLSEYFYLLRKTTNLDELECFFRERGQIGNLMTLVYDSVSRSSPLTIEYANYIKDKISKKTLNKKIKILEPSILEILKKEKKEGVYRAWVNRENALVLTMSVSLATLAVVTIGASVVVTMPIQYQAATLVTLRTASMVNTVVTRSVFAGNAAYNLSDRYSKEGWDGLKNLDSVLDVLMIVSVLPDPKLLQFAGSGSSLTLKSSQALLNTALLGKKYTPAAIISVIGGRGAYYYFNAENLTRDLHEQGLTHVTVSEVRKEGLKQIATAARIGFVRYVAPSFGDPLPSPKVIIPSAFAAPLLVSLPNLENE